MGTLFQTLILFLLLLPVSLAQALPEHLFNWAFAVPAQGPDVIPCQTVTLKTIAMSNGSDISVPPYSVASFEVNGIPDWQYNVSTNSTNIPWTVRHNAGTQLLVTVVDSVGNVGGVPQMITVLSGSNTTCLLSAPSNPPVISNMNVTGGQSLSTCGLWGMSVNGGTPPYGAFIVASGNQVFTPFNSSIPENTRLTYKNRALPNSQMIVSVQDSKGVWAVSTQAINTKGKTDTTCAGGDESSWITDAQFQAQEVVLEAAAAQAHKTMQITIALAVVFSLLGATIIGLAFWYWFRYRRSTSTSSSSSDLPLPPPPYDPEKGMSVSTDESSSANASSARLSHEGSAISGPIDLGRTASDAGDFGRRARAASELRLATYAIPDMSSSPPGNASPPRRANSTSPFPPGRQPSRKALEAAEERRVARERVPPAPALTSDGASPSANPFGYSAPGPSRQLTVTSTHSALNRQPSNVSSWQGAAAVEDSVNVSEPGTIIIQHSDAGASQVVVELPPAYVPSFNGRNDVTSPIAGSDTKSPYDSPGGARAL